jgi:hypothetical protein
MVTKYIKESEDMKILGDGVWALRRHGGTVVVICGVKRRDFKKMGVLLAAAGIFVPDMTHLKRCGFFGGAMSKRERLSRAKNKEKKIPYIRSETGEKKEARSSDKKRGPQWDSNPRGYEQNIGPAH